MGQARPASPGSGPAAPLPVGVVGSDARMENPNLYNNQYNSFSK